MRRGSSVDALVVRSRRTSSPYHSNSVRSPVGGVSAMSTTTRYVSNSLHPTHHHHGSGHHHRHHRSRSADLRVVRVSSNSASYMRVHVDRICPETLRYYNVPWERDSRDSDYIVIKRTCSQLELEDFYRHTKSIRLSKTSVSQIHTPHHDDHYDTTVTRRTTVVKKGGGTNWWGGALRY